MAIVREQFKHIYTGGQDWVTLDNPVSVGQVIMVGFENASNDPMLATCDDDLGNTYDFVDGVTSGTTALTVFRCIVTVAGTPTITVHPTGTSDDGLTAVVYSGTDGTILDFASDNIASTDVDVSLTLSAAGMVFAWFGNEFGCTVTGFNNLNEIYTDTGHDDSAADNLAVAAGGVTVGFDTDGGSLPHNCIIAVALQESGGGGGGGHSNYYQQQQAILTGVAL